MVMVVVVGDAQGVHLLVGVGVCVLLVVGVLMGVGGAVGMSMLVGVATHGMIVVEMHKKSPLRFLLL
jgi:hypothetical protein